MFFICHFGAPFFYFVIFEFGLEEWQNKTGTFLA